MKPGFFVAIAILVALLAWKAGRLRAKALPPSATQSFEQRYPGLPADALRRRARSMARLRAEGVPLNEWLPVVESEAALRLPRTEEVAMRAAATLVVALKGEGLEQRRVDELVETYKLKPWLSPEEAAFIADPAPSPRDREVRTWRFEAANALLWALGFVDRLGPPRTPCDPAFLSQILRDNSREAFLGKAKLRPPDEILDEADLIYRYRWALVDARIHGRAPPAGLSDDVAMERHQAFNWLLYHDEQPWDEVTLDT